MALTYRASKIVISSVEVKMVITYRATEITLLSVVIEIFRYL